MSDRLVSQIAAFEMVLTALAFYADPDTYFAIGFFPDPPCGEFMEDFSTHGGYDDDLERPGKRARAALAAWAEVTSV